MKLKKETIYEFLLKKITPLVHGGMTLEQISELDGVLWDIADVLGEKEVDNRI